jgi:hypothetical protein
VPAERVMMPVGDYVRVIDSPRCNPYVDTVRVDTGEKRFPKLSLFCR